MSQVCEVCGKHPVFSRSISHSHRVTNRQHRPNVQTMTCIVDGERKKIKVCAKCLKAGKVVRG
jgi:large subunit ribosomal protein L28